MTGGAKLPSEVRCVERMMAIERGRLPISDEPYSIDGIADRYSVHRDTVYKAVRSNSPLFPVARREGDGPKAWLYFDRAAIEVCDAARLKFYKTTPSWHARMGDGPGAAPPRLAARVVVGGLDGLSPTSRSRPGKA